MQRDAGNSLGLREWLSGYFVADAYVRRNVRYLYSKRGVLHAMCLGLIVENSLLEDAMKPFKVPTRGSGQCTDDVMAAAEAADDAATWMLLSNMLRDGLANVACSKPALGKIANPDEPLEDNCAAYAGGTVRMAVVGFGGTMCLRKMARSTFSFQPTAPETYTDNVVKSDEQVLQGRMSEQPANADAKDWVSTLLQARGPVASTTTRRANRVTDLPAEPAPWAEVVLEEVPEDLEDAVDVLIDRGWAEQETSGARLECGANALHQSLTAHGQMTGAAVPTRDEVLTALRHALPEAQRIQSEQAGVRIEDNNFTGDQMALALRRFGPYSLGIIDGPDQRARVYRVGDGEPIFVRNSANHWSGIGPGSKRLGLAPDSDDEG